MNFGDPVWFLALLLLPLIWYFYIRSIKKKKAAAIKFSNISLIKEAGAGISKAKEVLFYMNILLISLLITALADPHIPLTQTKEGVNVVVVMDVSGSMAATDYKPTRLEAARESAKILINGLNMKDNAGVVIFSSGATTSAYLSPFKDKVLEKLSAIKQTEGETAIGDGLALAVDMATSVPNKKKVIILMSDGVNNAGVISPDDAIRFAKTNNIQVYTIGIGSNEKVILGYDWFGRPQYADLDEATLQKIAEVTNGEYYKSVDSKTLEHIYSALPEKIEREPEDSSIKDWVIMAAIGVLLAELYLRFGRYRILP
ncbi:MAG: VWA domain-containing protein [Candidatus Methanoperedens sp.]|nr:VWA domain-containing protein [Candidatus Methanoperedens sp.]MCE8427134.1 VWA domain-containing protein [Candidatus Methanoperedens sp.]